MLARVLRGVWRKGERGFSTNQGEHIEGNSAPRGLSGRRRNAVLIVVLAMTFMSVLGGTIVNVALPVMQRDLGVDMAAIQWVSSIYLIVTSAGLLLFGRVGDLVGKVPVFQLGVALFTAGSALCAFSTTFEMLIAARAVQAIGGAASFATNQGIITETFPDGRGRALGFVAAVTAIGAMSGTAIGGFMIAALPWESIFVINLPIGTVSFVAGLAVFPRVRVQKRGRFDAAGAALLALAITLSFCGLTLMERGITPQNGAMLVAGIALLALFVLVERRVQDPLVDLSFFRSIRFDADLAVLALVFLAMSAYFFIFPYYLQEARGMNAAVAGLVMMCYPLVNSVVGPLSGAISDKIGCEIPAFVGAAIYAVGLALLGCLQLDTPLPLVIACLMFTSLGTAIYQAPANSLVMGHASAEALGLVGALGNLMRYLGQTVGITVGPALLYTGMSAAAGYPVTSYIEGRPDVFIDGMQPALHAIACIVAVGAAIAAWRLIDARRKAKRAGETTRDPSRNVTQ